MFLFLDSPILVLTVVSLWALTFFAQSRKLILVSLFSTLLILVFFRDFMGTIQDNEDIIVSPCDGRVMAVQKEGDHINISVRLSLIDRHVQIVPYTGTVVSQYYKRGSFHPVYFFEKTDYNESLTTTFNTRLGAVYVKQVAGQIARRIVSYINKDEHVVKGDKLGLIKFGSRVDISVPDSLRVLVNPGDILRIGQSIASRFN